VYTDSQYVIKGIEEWVGGWKARGWKTADKKPVKNQDLWERLDALAAQHSLEWHWVKGHSGIPGNERVDALANRAIDEVLRELRRSCERAFRVKDALPRERQAPAITTDSRESEAACERGRRGAPSRLLRASVSMCPMACDAGLGAM
jgi:hypothetical protein